MDSSNSKYATFLESYDKGNQFLNNITLSFFNQINFDVNKIIENDDNLLKDKFTHVLKLIQDSSTPNYDKSLLIGGIIADSSKYILSSKNKDIKNSGINLINNFLNIAKETEDQQLMNIAMKISENVNTEGV